MIYNWFELFSLPEFLASGLVSRNLNVILEGVGQKDIIITHGNEVGIQFEDVFLIVGFGGKNPWSLVGSENTYAVYQDSDQIIWLGIRVSG